MHGFAAVGSNNGHNGTTAKAMYRNPDVVLDFASRAYVNGALCYASNGCRVIRLSTNQPSGMTNHLHSTDSTLALMSARN